VIIMGQKYKQQGYQDGDKKENRTRSADFSGRREGPKSPKMTAFQGVMRCNPCGQILPSSFDHIAPDSTCSACNAALHTCTHCSFFDPSQRYECTQPLKRRISPKDVAHDCAYFSPRTTVEKKITSNPDHEDPKAAFERLFGS
jgi:hypothetical protein